MDQRIKEWVEQCTVVLPDGQHEVNITQLASLIRADERAACAVIADRYDNGRADNAADLIANEIRQRGEK